MVKCAFTLIEVLIVVAIIATLAVMLISAVFVGDTTAKDTACRNNLRQLASAIGAWQARPGAAGKFPGQLLWLSDEAKGAQDLDGDYRIYKCPVDASDGTDADVGRPSSWNSAWVGGHSPYEPGSSYLYEMSNATFPGTTATWAQWKRWQQQWGNGTATYPNQAGGRAFPRSRMPVVRCFHHHEWQDVAVTDNIQRVFNVAWDASVFTSRPEWELDVDQ